jgi:hypothetical protein
MSTGIVLRLGLLLGLGHSLLLAAGPRDIQSKWTDLAPLVTDRKIALVLPAGTHIQGKVLAVEPDGLRMKVTKTSDRKVLAKGERLIPRQSVSVLRLTEYRKAGRLLCTVGSVAVVAAIIASQDIDLYEGPLVVIVPAVSAVGAVGAGVGGYFAGKRIDRREVYIRVLPPD